MTTPVELKNETVTFKKPKKAPKKEKKNHDTDTKGDA